MKPATHSIAAPSDGEVTASARELLALRGYQRRLLYAGGGLLSLLIVLTAIAAIWQSLLDYYDSRRQVQVEGRVALNDYLIQRERGYMRSLLVNDVAWNRRRDDLLRRGEGLEEAFTTAGEQLLIQAGDYGVPWLAIGRGTSSLTPGHLAAHLGMLYESSSYTSNTVPELEARGSLSVYAYDSQGVFFAMTRMRDEAQLLAALGVATRELAFARLMLAPERLLPNAMSSGSFESARKGLLVSYFGEDPFDRRPALVGVMSQHDGDDIHYRYVVFDPIEKLRERLRAVTDEPFMVVSRAGEAVLESGDLHGNTAGRLAMLRDAGLWRDWRGDSDRHLASHTFFLADQLMGVDWAIVHLFGWQDIWAALRFKLALSSAIAASILAMLWALLLCMDRRVFAPAWLLALKNLMAQADASLAKSHFVAMVSHEIRTPLNGILGHLELMGREPLASHQHARLQCVAQSAQSLLDILNNVLDFSRIESGHAEVDAVPFSLRALVEQVVLLFTPQAQRKGLQLHVDMQPSLATSYIGDVARVRQVLNNLLANAVKFTRTGRIALYVRASEREKPALCFDIEDSGIGMTPAQLAQVFEPFTQADAGISRRYGGSGLGLALCRQLADLLGGTVEAKSVAGVGSTFRFTVPAAPVPPQAEVGVSKDQRTLSGLRLPELGEQPDRGTVLLVEDHPLNRELIKQQLEALGFAVDAVDDGETAVQRWRIVPCIAVVTDIQLPGMSGYALAAALRQQGATLPILAVSAMAPPGEQQRCLDAGITELLFKPLSLERLGDALGAQLGLLRERVMPSIRGGRLPDHVRRLFVEAGRDDLDALQAARQEGDVQALRQRLHAVKGVLQMIGEADTARLFLALEHQCETRGAVAQDLWNQAIEAMQALLADHAKDISAP